MINLPVKQMPKEYRRKTVKHLTETPPAAIMIEDLCPGDPQKSVQLLCHQSTWTLAQPLNHTDFTIIILRHATEKLLGDGAFSYCKFQDRFNSERERLILFVAKIDAQIINFVRRRIDSKQ